MGKNYTKSMKTRLFVTNILGDEQPYLHYKCKLYDTYFLITYFKHYYLYQTDEKLNPYINLQYDTVLVNLHP
jgi:hypothetical protein